MRPTTTGAAAAAWVLAAGVFAAMLVTSGTVRDVLVGSLAVLQVGLHLLAVRAFGASPWGRVAVLWSVQAGLTWLVAGDPSTTSVLVYVATGLAFALLAEMVLRVAERFAAVDDADDVEEPADPDGRPAGADTTPLPLRDGGS